MTNTTLTPGLRSCSLLDLSLWRKASCSYPQKPCGEVHKAFSWQPSKSMSSHSPYQDTRGQKTHSMSSECPSKKLWIAPHYPICFLILNPQYLGVSNVWSESATQCQIYLSYHHCHSTDAWKLRLPPQGCAAIKLKAGALQTRACNRIVWRSH